MPMRILPYPIIGRLFYSGKPKIVCRSSGGCVDFCALAVGNVKSQQNDSIRRSSQAIDQLAKVLALGQHDTPFRESARQQIVIGPPRNDSTA